MIPAKLIEISVENKVHDLTRLLSVKPKIVIGRRNNFSAGQADIIFGEDKDGKPNAEPSVIFGVSRRHAIITYEDGNYCIEDCSTFGTKINDEPLRRGEKKILENGVTLLFGGNDYGPVTFWQEIQTKFNSVMLISSSRFLFLFSKFLINSFNVNFISYLE